LFVCTNARGAGKPTCGPRGGDALIAEVQRALLARGGADGALVTPCGCFGTCFDGPNAVIYPEGVWLAQLAPSDGDALAACLVGDLEAALAPLADKRAAPPGHPDSQGE